jgi:hypothetical protein
MKEQNNCNDPQYKIEKIYISELGFLMVKLFNKEKKVWTTMNFGKWDEILNFDSFNINIDDIDIYN